MTELSFGLASRVSRLPHKYSLLVDAEDISNALLLVLNIFEECGKMLSQEEIYKIDREIGDNADKANAVIHTAYETLRVGAILLQVEGA